MYENGREVVNTDRDEEIARALQERYRSGMSSPPRRASPSPSPTRSSSSSSSGTVDVVVGGYGDDASFAVYVGATESLSRRLDRVMRDAEYASALALEERRRAVVASPSSSYSSSVPLGGVVVRVSGVDDDGFDVLASSSSDPNASVAGMGGGHVVPPVVRGRATSSSSSSSSSSPPDDCRGRTLYFGIRVILVTITVGITFVVWMSLFGRSVSDDLDPASWMPGFPEGDPNLGSVGEHNRWYVSDDEGGGLTLPVLNNLVDGSDWTSYLEGSVSDWDSGTPDAVTLRIRSMDYDPDCRAVRMAMKVCNGDYGPTDWRGVNQVLLQDDYIITSIAKMNDYYLEGTNAAQKQYTMCHELGHGLGLGHSDENFHNLDMGNCMDYTNMPQNNLHPDEHNFLILEELYGNVNNGNNNGNSSSVSAEEMLSEVPSGDGRRATATAASSSSSSVDEFEIYAAYLSDPIVVSTNNGEVVGGESRTTRLLSKTKTAEHHESILGNGYSIRTSILLA